MALYKTTIAFQPTNGIPADITQNSFHFLTNEANHTPAIASALNGHVGAAFENINAPGIVRPGHYLASAISRVNKPVLKTYAALVGNDGSPLATDVMAAFQPAVVNFDLPGQVACVLSFRGSLVNIPEEAPDDPDADAAPERPASRRRGRIFFGPLNIEAQETASPSVPKDDLRNVLLGIAEGLFTIPAGVLTVAGTQWVVRSDSGFAGGSEPIIVASVDNRWDTQRRRLRKPTSRVSRIL